MTFSFFRKNTSVKIVSFFVAILIWIIAINADNPYKSRDINVPLTVINENSLHDKDIVLVDSNYKRSVNITIWGRKEVIDKASPDDFKAILDFSKVNSAADESIEIIGPIYENKDIEIKYMTPTNIDVAMEALETGTFPVIVDLVGEPRQGYKIISVAKIPESMDLKDIKSLVDVADTIRTVIDVTDIDSAKSIIAECKVYNKKGEEITALGPRTAEVKIDVAREVQISLDVIGKPDADYVETSRTFTPTVVLVNGPSADVSKIVTLKTETIDITGATENVVKTVGIKLPAGVKLVDSDETVMATIVFEKLVEKSITLQETDISFINTDVSFIYDIQLSEPAVISIKGKKADIDKIDAASLNPRVDVAGLTAGIHSAAVILNLPASVQLITGAEIPVAVSSPGIQ